MRFKTSTFFLDTFSTGWHRWAAWFICIGTIILLGALRTETDAEYAFASLALLPVLAITWTEGRRNGLLLAWLAAAMWAIADIASERQFSSTWIPWVNAATRLMTYSLLVILTAQVRLQLERAHELATHDPLTGLLNRRAFFEAGASETERSQRYAHSLSIVFLDLDNFKQLNDSKGHDAGDAALQVTAKALHGTMRSNDRVARLGGDEFAILLPEIGYDAAVEAGRKISVALNKALRDYPPVSASVGVAWFAKVNQPFPEMLKMADELMYEVKESGKGGMRSRRYTAAATPS